MFYKTDFMELGFLCVGPALHFYYSRDFLP
jgi:hypothetical protein